MASYKFMIKKKRATIKDPNTSKKVNTKDWRPEAFIYLRVISKDDECLIATKKSININHWDEDLGQPKSSYPAGKKALVNFLTGKNGFKGKVMDAETQLENELNRDVTADEIKERYTENKLGVTRTATHAVPLWRVFLHAGTASKSPDTTKTETQSLKKFLEFLKTEGKTDIFLRKIDKDLVNRYSAFLSKYSANYKAVKLKHFKAFLKSINHPATALVKFKERPGNKIFLTEGELTQIETYDFKNDLRLDRVRDLFVLQCATGLRVSDLKRLGGEHIQGNDLIVRAKKNDESIRMPLTNSIRRIFEKYKIFEKYTYSLPVISDVKYNKYLKEVGAAAIPEAQVELTDHRNNQKIHTTVKKAKKLSTHCAVRTFITLRGQRGMPIPSIAAITGKTVAIILSNYLSADKEQAYQDAQKYDRPDSPVMALNVG